MKNEYYYCFIGPTDRKKLDKKYPNGEGILRSRIKDTFLEVAGHEADRCSSGWGQKKENVDQIWFAANNEETKKALIQSYFDEKKAMPRYVRAWYLLLKEEKNWK